MVDVWIMAPARARRDWLVSSLSHAAGIRVAGTAGTFPSLRALMSEISADLAVVDLQSQTDPIVRDWLFELLDLTAIVLLSSELDAAIFNRVLHTRIGGVLRADAASEQIVQAIQSVGSGLMTFDGAAMPRVIFQQHDDEPPSEPLTPRESEVLRWLADGLGNRQIARRLSVSEHTIKFHIGSILGKLGASSRTEAVSRGLRSGLIEL